MEKLSVSGLTLEELKDILNRYPAVSLEKPSKELNQTLFSWLEWLRLNPLACELEKEKAFSIDFDYCEWLMFWESFKNEKVYFYDYINNIAYIDPEMTDDNGANKPAW